MGCCFVAPGSSWLLGHKPCVQFLNKAVLVVLLDVVKELFQELAFLWPQQWTGNISWQIWKNLESWTAAPCGALDWDEDLFSGTGSWGVDRKLRMCNGGTGFEQVLHRSASLSFSVSTLSVCWSEVKLWQLEAGIALAHFHATLVWFRLRKGKLAVAMVAAFKWRRYSDSMTNPVAASYGESWWEKTRWVKPSLLPHPVIPLLCLLEIIWLWLKSSETRLLIMPLFQVQTPTLYLAS